MSLLVLLPSPSHPNTLEKNIFQELNNVRIENHLKPLRYSKSLFVAADRHSKDMLKKGYFRHRSLDGTKFWERIQKYYPFTKRRWKVGEVIFIKYQKPNAEEIVQAWLNSLYHKKVILLENWKQMGVGLSYGWAKRGFFKNKMVWLITVDFGRR